MALDPDSRSRFNLKNAQIMLVENGSMDMQILVQMLVGFGARNMHKFGTIEEAKLTASKMPLDLIIIGARLPDGDGFDLVKWIRSETAEPNRFAPTLMLSGHTALSKVKRARDCGAHFIIAKPLTPIVLLERIVWIAKEGRPFVEMPIYVGPDRRFKFEGPPVNTTGRRHDDLSADIGDTAAPNMSQEQIDAMMAPRKVAL
jgi:DNA-binding response OmpR family regulator